MLATLTSVRVSCWSPMAASRASQANALARTLILNPGITRIIKTFFWASVYINVSAGIWHYIGQSGEDETNNWIVHAGYDDVDSEGRYIIALYWVVTTFTSAGYGDIIPQNDGEYAFAMFIMVTGIVGCGVIVADILNIVSSMARNNEAQKERIEQMNQLIKYVDAVCDPDSKAVSSVES